MNPKCRIVRYDPENPRYPVKPGTKAFVIDEAGRDILVLGDASEATVPMFQVASNPEIEEEHLFGRSDLIDRALELGRSQVKEALKERAQALREVVAEEEGEYELLWVVRTPLRVLEANTEGMRGWSMFLDSGLLARVPPGDPDPEGDGTFPWEGLAQYGGGMGQDEGLIQAQARRAWKLEELFPE